MSVEQRWTAWPAALPTRTAPLRSRIGPRGACSRTVRSWLFCAACRYCGPERIWSAQRRRKSTAKTPSRITPRIASRNATCGVSRYGSATRGSGGRKRLDGERGSPVPALAKESHRGEPLEPVRAAEEPADERVDRQREQQIPTTAASIESTSAIRADT